MSRLSSCGCRMRIRYPSPRQMFDLSLFCETTLTTSCQGCSIRLHSEHRGGLSSASPSELPLTIDIFRVGHFYLESAQEVRTPCQCLHRRFPISSPIRPHTMTDRRLDSLSEQTIYMGFIVHLSTTELLRQECVGVDSRESIWALRE